MNTMKYTVTPESPVDIEISANGETHNISFYPTDLAVRERFYQTYENLKNYKPKEFKVVVDKNGVSNAELENAKVVSLYRVPQRASRWNLRRRNSEDPHRRALRACGAYPFHLRNCKALHPDLRPACTRQYTEAIRGGVMK